MALLFAMTGGAFASVHYLITSTKQISPAVRSQLRGDTGPRGPVGDRGPAGPTGPAGASGPAGAAGATGAAGAARTPGQPGAVIAAPVRSTAAVTTATTNPSSPTWSSVPVSGNTSTQGSSESDEIVGDVDVTAPIVELRES
jgi:hypothetical protein